MMKRLYAGFALLEIIAVLAAILMLFYFVLRFNPRTNRPQFDKKTETAVKDAGIDTQNYITIKESMKNKVEEITRQRSQDLDAAANQIDK